MFFVSKDFFDALKEIGPLRYGGGGGLVSRSCPTLTTSWTAACQSPLLMEFPRPAYWSGLLFPSPVDLPDPGNKPGSLALLAVTCVVGVFFTD